MNYYIEWLYLKRNVCNEMDDDDDDDDNDWQLCFFFLGNFLFILYKILYWLPYYI